MSLTTEEKRQYNRHLILKEIGAAGQLKLKQSKVLIIGAGGLGAPILQYLTAAGVGTIGIIDHDIIDQSNLQRQVLYAHSDIGQSKVNTAISRLSSLNPFISFNGYNELLTKDNAIKIFQSYDIIVDGSDNFPTRYLVNDAAVLTNKPLVFGSIYKFEGQVTVFNYQNGPTYRCLFPTPPAPGEVPNCSEIGVLGVLPGLIGSLQANETIKIITGIGDVLSGKLLTYNTLSLTQVILTFKKNTTLKILELEKDYDYFCGIFENTDDMRYAEIDYTDIKEQLDQYFLIDVREDWERLEGHLGGIHIPVHEIPERLNEINTELPVVVYCQSGKRGKTATLLLSDIAPQFKTYNLTGGLNAIEVSN